MESVSEIICNHLFVWNMLFAIVIVFFQRRDPKSVWAWILLLYFVPVLGFLFYLLLGQDMRKRKIFRAKELEDRISVEIRQQAHHLREAESSQEEIGDFRDLILYNLETSGAVLTEDNDIDIFTEGSEKFKALLQDLRQAERFIHIQYYIIKNDILFHQIAEILAEKAAAGVAVRVLFDAMGCRSVRHRYWRSLNEKGIMTAEFFPAQLGRLQFRINYRNHRKIVVIDNRVAYVGGFNIGKEYVGLDSRFGHWRDTHLRIHGSGAWGLQLRFVLDWNYAAKENLFPDKSLFEGIAPGGRDACKMQIISSGPDKTGAVIRDNYLRLIHRAKKSICIQTPYFIPDESILNALLIAVRSGVEVNIMIPCMPDHLFVYWATFSYVGDLVMAGANCYTYHNGFLHGKGMIVDGRVFCYGTANMDIRSFELNFEVNAVVYNRQKAQEMEEIFRDDLAACKQITRDDYAVRTLAVRIKEQICRLLSPLL